MARNQNKAEWRLKRSLEEKHRQTHSEVYFFNKTSFFTPINRPRFLNCVLAFQLSCTYTRRSETFLHPIRNNIMWKGVDESSSIFSFEFVPMPIMQLNWDLFLDFMPSSEDYDFISLSMHVPNPDSCFCYCNSRLQRSLMFIKIMEICSRKKKKHFIWWWWWLCDSTDRARHVVNCSLQLLDLILMVMQAAIVNPFFCSRQNRLRYCCLKDDATLFWWPSAASVSNHSLLLSRSLFFPCSCTSIHMWWFLSPRPMLWLLIFLRNHNQQFSSQARNRKPISCVESDDSSVGRNEVPNI